MRTSSRRTTTAVLRQIIEKRDFELADILGRSKFTIHALESGRLKLSHELATRMFHETGISLDWLLKGDPKAPISGRGEPYTKETFEKARAEKIYFDRPHPFFEKTDALQFCARLAGMLKSASSRKQHYMAKYKLGEALGALENEFGQEKDIHFTQKQIDLLQPLVAHGEALKQIKSEPQSKRPSKKKRRR